MPLEILTFFSHQGPDAVSEMRISLLPTDFVLQVHILQVGAKELKRAPALHEFLGEIQRKSAENMEKAGVKAHL